MVELALVELRASGQVVKFDGFLTLYLEGQDDESDEDGSKLPKVAAGAELIQGGQLLAGRIVVTKEVVVVEQRVEPSLADERRDLVDELRRAFN